MGQIYFIILFMLCSLYVSLRLFEYKTPKKKNAQMIRLTLFNAMIVLLIKK